MIIFTFLTQAGPAFAAETNADFLRDIPPGVRLERNVDFLGVERTEKADLYFPRTMPANSRLPAVVMIHGGGWNDGRRDAQREKNIGTTLALSGYVGMSIDYQLSYGKFTTWPQNLYDCKNAVRWLRKNAGRLQIDPERIGVIGGSAGGHLADMVALTGPGDGLEPAEPYPGISDSVVCCVDLYGITDITTYLPSPTMKEPYASMLGKKFSEAPQLYRIASPVNYVRTNSPPFLIIHGTADQLVSPQQSKSFDALLQNAGVEHELVLVEGAPHAFTLQPKQRDLRPLVLDFFNRHLKRK